MVKIIAKIVRAFLQWKLREDLKLAIHQAEELRYKNHKKYLVLYVGGKFQPVEKQHAKTLLRQGGYFRKGVNMKQLEAAAYYITD